MFEDHKYFDEEISNNPSHLDPLPPNPFIFSEVFNVAFGGNTNLLELFEALKKLQEIPVEQKFS